MAHWHSYQDYVPVHERLANAKRAVVDQLGRGEEPQPIEKFGGRGIAKTFWGQSWCANLESYSDFENRLPRGRTYTRNGSIVHLGIHEGEVTAFIAGSELYTVRIRIDALDRQRWEQFKTRCQGKIDTLLDLLQGKVADAVLQEITDHEEGLFPAPKEIAFECSCPDAAYMCKHVAATLYGVGVRLDTAPELFFTLRGVDQDEIMESVSADALEESLPEHDDLLVDSDLGSIFGIEFSDLPDIDFGQPKKLRAKGRRPRR